MKVSFAVPDPSMPRTIYYDRFADAVRRNPRFVEEPVGADICLPAEDVALETNWPRYGNPQSAYVRGQGHDLSEGGGLQAYFSKIVALAKSKPANCRAREFHAVLDQSYWPTIEQPTTTKTQVIVFANALSYTGL